MCKKKLLHCNCVMGTNVVMNQNQGVHGCAICRTVIMYHALPMWQREQWRKLLQDVLCTSLPHAAFRRHDVRAQRQVRGDAHRLLVALHPLQLVYQHIKFLGRPHAAIQDAGWVRGFVAVGAAIHLWRQHDTSLRQISSQFGHCDAQSRPCVLYFACGAEIEAGGQMQKTSGKKVEGSAFWFMSSSGPRLMASTDIASILPLAKETSLVLWLPLRSRTCNKRVKSLSP